jgi:hypothetical protein
MQITLKFNYADLTRTVVHMFESVEAAIDFINSHAACNIGDSVSIVLDGKAIAFINGPRWFAMQEFIEEVEYDVTSIVGADTINFLYDSKHPAMRLIKAVNTWAGVNIPQRQHSLSKDGGKIIFANAVMEVLSGCTVYPDHPIGLSYDGGKTAIYCKTMDGVARELRQLDIKLMP